MSLSFLQYLFLSFPSSPQLKPLLKQQLTLKFKIHPNHQNLNRYLEGRGLRRTHADDWNLLWTNESGFEELRMELEGNECEGKYKVNHFLGSKGMWRIEKMWERERRWREREGREGRGWIPETFEFPKDEEKILGFMNGIEKKSEDNVRWIFRNTGKSSLRSFSFIVSSSELIKELNKANHSRQHSFQDDHQPQILQQFIFPQLTIGGKLFTLRVYALVTSYDPLTLYLYHEGALFFSDKLLLSSTTIIHKIHHLTGYSIQHFSSLRNKKHQWNLSRLKLYLVSKYGCQKTNRMLVDMERCVLETLRAGEDQMGCDNRCFEMYRFDFVVDEGMGVWLVGGSNR